MIRRAASLLALVALAVLPRLVRADETHPPRSVHDSGAARTALQEAKRASQEGPPNVFAQDVERLLEPPLSDDLVEESSDPIQTRWVGAPEAANRLLEAATPEQRRAYDDAFAATAATRLEEATELRDETRLAEVLDRYGATPSGIEAARRLAESAFEAGRAPDAAVAAEKGLRWAKTDSGLWLRRIEALESAGDGDALGAIVLPESLAPASTSKGPVELPARLAAARERTPRRSAPPRDWPELAGAPDHDRAFSSEAPLHTRRYAVGEPVRGRDKDEGNLHFELDGGGSVNLFLHKRDQSFPLVPALVDRRLFVADGTSVYALDLYSGRRVWRFPSQPRAVPGLPLSDPGRESDSAVPWSKGRTSIDFVHAPAVEGGVVYASVEVEVPYQPQPLQQIDTTTYMPKRVLVALDAKTGALRWYAGQTPEERRALGGMTVVGPPVVSEGLVVVVGARNEHRWLAAAYAFDAATGKRRWTRDLVSSQQELNLFGNPVHEMYAGAPAVKGGVVYAPSGLGVFAALRLRTGEPIWLSSYETIEVPRPELWFETPMRYAVFGPSPPVVHGDVVLVAAPDSPSLLCFERADGRLRWANAASSVSRGARDGVDYLLGVGSDGTREVALVSERGVRALDLRTGKIAWAGEMEDPSEEVRGRGAITPTQVVLATTHGLARFSVRAEGRYLGTDAWPEDAEKGGNVLAFPEVLVVAGRGNADGRSPGPIQGFYAWEDLEKAFAARRAAHPEDLGLLVEAADVWLVVGDETRAEDLYREALRAAEAKGSSADGLRAKQGLHALYLARALRLGTENRLLDAKGAIALALSHATSPAERAAARLYLDDLLEREGPESRDARIDNLEALVREGGDAIAPFRGLVAEPSTQAIALPVRIGGRLRLASVLVGAGRFAPAIDALQVALERDGDASIGDETVRSRVRREIDAVIAVAGPSAYAKHEAAAERALAEAAKSQDPAAYRRVVDRWPNAASVPAAFLGLAQREAEAGRPADAASTLRRLLSAYPEHPRVPEALARLARVLAAAGSADGARAALAALERRHADAKITLDGKTTTGAEFAAALRAALPARPPAPPEAAFEPPVEEAMLVNLDPPQNPSVPWTAHCVPVARSHSGPVPAPVLVDVGEETWAVDPLRGQVVWRTSARAIATGDRPCASAPDAFHPVAAVLAGDVLVLADHDVLVALDPRSGTTRWCREVRGNPHALDAAEGQVLLLVQESGGPMGRGCRLVSVDAITGDVLWTQSFPGDSGQSLYLADEAVAVVRRRGRQGWVVGVHSLLAGALVKEISVSSPFEPIVALAGGRTILVASQEPSATRVEAYDLPTATLRWSRAIADADRRVSNLIPRADAVLVVDAGGGLHTLALGDGSVRAETRVSGWRPIPGSDPVVDDQRLYALQTGEGTVPSVLVACVEIATGRRLWSAPLLRTPSNAGVLIVSGDTVVTLVTPPLFLRRASTSVSPPPPALRVWFIDTKTGVTFHEFSSQPLASWKPSAVMSDGGLVIAGVEAVAVYR